MTARALEGIGSDSVLLADKAYDTEQIREQLDKQGALANIPGRSNRRENRPFSKPLYKERNLIERFFNRIKHFRRIATRFEIHATNYLAMVKLAAIRIWLRVYESMN